MAVPPALSTRFIPSSVLDAFGALVAKHPAPDGCWLWTGPRDGRGQPNCPRPLRPYLGTSARRAAYALHHGAALPWAVVLHPACGKPLCVNPAHMHRGPRGRSALWRETPPLVAYAAYLGEGGAD